GLAALWLRAEDRAEQLRRAKADVEEKNQEIRGAKDEAERQRDAARLQAYVSSVNLAQRAWDAGQGALLMDLLARTRPEDGQKDLRGFEWHHLWRMTHSEGLTLRGHDGFVFSVALRPDGRRLASAGTDRTVKVWDADTGQQLLSFPAHGAEVRRILFSPDGRR